MSRLLKVELVECLKAAIINSCEAGCCWRKARTRVLQLPVGIPDVMATEIKNTTNAYRFSSLKRVFTLAVRQGHIRVYRRQLDACPQFRA